MEFKPSYDLYRRIIRDIKASGKYADYADVIYGNKKDEFVIMRHDVEFSMERAYELSLVESGMDFCSTYFIQITNNSYNAFSKRSIDMMHDMADRGHHIGLHYHCNGEKDAETVRDGVRDQIRIMTEIVDLPIDRFSFHRPAKEIYYYKTHIRGIINAYSPDFFSYAENVDGSTKLEVKYIADSKHRWNYGYPDLETFHRYPKIQLLLHPFSWTNEGYDNMNNFYTLINEKQKTLIETMDEEFLRFREVRKDIEEKLGK